MFLVNVLEYCLALETIKYIFMAFAFFGAMLCVQKLALGK